MAILLLMMKSPGENSSIARHIPQILLMNIFEWLTRGHGRVLFQKTYDLLPEHADGV